MCHSNESVKIISIFAFIHHFTAFNDFQTIKNRYQLSLGRDNLLLCVVFMVLLADL